MSGRNSRPGWESGGRLAFADALRGCAILMVAAVHVGLFSRPDSIFHFVSRYGQLGVQLFFVVSAFSISYAAENSDAAWKTKAAFMVRRWFRVAPMYYLAIAGYFLFAVVWKAVFPWPAPFLQPGEYAASDVLLNLAFLHGLSPSANNTIVPGGWSLATEFGFYLLFAAFLLGAGSKRLKWVVGTYAVLALLTLGWLIPDLAHLARNNEFLYFSLLVQLPCFFAGLIANRIYRRGGWSASAAWMAAVGPWPAIFWLWDSGLAWAYLAIPAISAVSFAGIVLLLSRAGPVPHWLTAVGERSYSIYLVHLVFVVTLVQPIARTLSFLGASTSELAAYAVVVLLSYFVADITFRVVEKPGIALGKKVSKAITAS